jgi:cysteine desulfurase
MAYLDHNATTPLDARVLEAMLPYLESCYGNPSGLYKLGRLSRSAIDAAREQVAALVGAEPSEVYFTSGGTEANNLALKGLALALPKGVIAIGATEHPSVSEPAHRLGTLGWQIEVIPVDGDGLPDASFLDTLPQDALRVAALMLANNETGAVHPIAPIAERVRARGGFLHCDAVQAAGKLPVDFKRSGAHMLSLSAHKLYGPKGVGALVAERSVPLEALLDGGGQERGLRAGSENVAGIVGFGKAAELALSELEQRRARLLHLRARLEAGLAELTGIALFAQGAERLPNTAQFGVAGCDGEALVMNLDRKGCAISSGSACASGGGEPSPVLTAMGVDADTAKSAIRVSLGKDNTEADIDRFLAALRDLMGASRP